VLSTIGTPTLWAVFGVLVLAALVIDLLVLNAKGAQKVGFREALVWSLAWVALALAFNAWLWWHVDGIAGRAEANRIAAEFFTGYLIEKSLAVDNVFVFLMLFSAFGVPAAYQRRVLVLGIVGAIVLRAVMILVGAWLLARFHWLLYVFGAFLLLTGVKMLFDAEAEPDLERNSVLKWLRRHIRITAEYHGERFTVVTDGVRWYTPLFVVMAMIAITDVIFAVDSIPAIFAVTLDPFIVLTSNIFAVLGLRAMYFMLADLADRFHLLKYGLAFILVFIGIKMLLLDVYKIPIGFALAVVFTVLAISMVGSLYVTRPGAKRPPPS
jgi:tellurite resistance protein TerC